MCFAIPGKVINIKGEKAIVEFVGQRKEINIKFVDVKKGDYIITAGNIAADIISTAKAEELIDAFIKSNREMNNARE